MGIGGPGFLNNPKRAPRLPMYSIQSLVSKWCESQFVEHLVGSSRHTGLWLEMVDPTNSSH